MANPEHVAILKKGAPEWNRWRQAQLNAMPSYPTWPKFDMDLSGADFSKSQLSTAELFATNLTDTSFAGADLTGANFGRLRFGITGDGAWWGAMFETPPTTLLRSNFVRAKLLGARFEDCLLVDVDFSHASFGSTLFVNVSLAQVKGLELCKHAQPSFLDHQTLLKSGVLPTPFLRGCGLSDAFIEYLPSLSKEPIHFYSCFISYSSKDEEFVGRLYADLQNKGIRCWYAPEDLRIGDKFRVCIDQSIRVHDKLLVVLSEKSIRSPWVEEEVEAGLERERLEGRLLLFPIRLDEAVMKTDQAWAASLRRQRHIADFSNWENHSFYKKGLDRLLRDLKPVDKVIAVSP